MFQIFYEIKASFQVEIIYAQNLLILTYIIYGPYDMVCMTVCMTTRTFRGALAHLDR